VAPEATAAPGGQPHNFSSIGCTHCHLFIPNRSATVNKQVYRHDISSLCLECHNDSRDNRVNHRIGIVPSMKVPDDLKLGSRGELTCVTCHMPHLPPTDPRGARTYFLRRSMLKRELCLACHRSDRFDEPLTTARVITPPDNSIIKTLPVPLIGTVSDPTVREVVVSINDVPLRLSVSNGVFSTFLSLQEGVNHVQIDVQNGRPVPLTLLHNPGLGQDITYKLFYSHGIFKKSDCRACHDGPQPQKLASSDERVICGKCHDPVNRKRMVHGPVAVGSCSVCHDPHGSNNRYFLIAQGDRLCLTCHSERQILTHFLDQVKRAPNASVEGCTTCHLPHESDKKKLLR
jgi:predicted CXXCH cytochrome family protein